jgi:diadenosine tetraphosphatase ApaH/serine/threonine PP2A family protein phosphatase
MRDDDLRDMIFRVLISRCRGESHLGKGALAGCSVRRLLDAVTEVLMTEPAHLKVHGDFVVVGDLHGQIDDLLRIFGRFGYPPVQKYLFLGDYVDRGKNSIEVMIILYALKVLYPSSVILLRGNHESECATRAYGFKEECSEFFKKRKTYHLFCKSFTYLPVAATVNKAVFCVHGGLAPSLAYVSDINDQVKKPLVDIGLSMAEGLMWSDPSADVESGFKDSPRGVGYLFGQEQLDWFLEDNNLSLMIRAHQYCESGSRLALQGCLTVFSACNYCGRGNDAALVMLRSGENAEVCPLPYLPGVPARVLWPEWLFSEGKPMREPVLGLDALADVFMKTESLILC